MLAIGLWTFLLLNSAYGASVLGERESVLLGYFLVLSWPFVLNFLRLRRSGDRKTFEIVVWMSLAFWISGYISLFQGKEKLLDIIEREKEGVTVVDQELHVPWDFPFAGFSLSWGTYYLLLIFPSAFEQKRGFMNFVLLVLDVFVRARIPNKLSDMPMMLSPGILPLIAQAL